MKLDVVLSRATLLALLAFVGGGCSSDKSKEKDEPSQKNDAAPHVEAGPTFYPCSKERPFLGPDNGPTGYMYCEGDKSYHRPEAATCGTLLPRTTGCGTLNAPDGSAPPADCHHDTDCTTKPNGFCNSGSSSAYCYCDYGCTVDSDCPGGYICQCSGPVGKCVQSTCTTDADCGGAQCRSGLGPTCSTVFACQSKDDKCNTHAECGPAMACVVRDGKRSCEPTPTCR